jgi:hypothetical protein
MVLLCIHRSSNSSRIENGAIHFALEVVKYFDYCLTCVAECILARNIYKDDIQGIEATMVIEF